jgi:hypothetical protein
MEASMAAHEELVSRRGVINRHSNFELATLADAVAGDRERHPDGIGLADFFEKFWELTQDQILELIAQLERMKVYRLKHTPAGARADSDGVYA